MSMRDRYLPRFRLFASRAEIKGSTETEPFTEVLSEAGCSLLPMWVPVPVLRTGCLTLQLWVPGLCSYLGSYPVSFNSSKSASYTPIIGLATVASSSVSTMRSGPVLVPAFRVALLTPLLLGLWL